MIATDGFLTALRVHQLVSLQCSARTLSRFKGALLLRRGEGKEKGRGQRRGRRKLETAPVCRQHKIDELCNVPLV